MGSLGLVVVLCLLFGGMGFAAAGYLAMRRERAQKQLMNIGLIAEPNPHEVSDLLGLSYLSRGRWRKGGSDTLLKARQTQSGPSAREDIPSRFFANFEIPNRYHLVLLIGVKSFVFLVIWLIAGPTGEVFLVEALTVTDQIVMISLSLAVAIWLPEYAMAVYLKRRADEMEQKAPDIIDLLTLSVEVGLSFDQAVLEVADLTKTVSPRLSNELTMLSQELRLLPVRETAFDNLIERTGSDSFKNLKLALTQGDTYGTPIGHSLRRVAIEARERTLAKKESMARKLPVFLSLPLMLLILPPVIVLSTGPGFIQLMTVIGGG